MPISLQHYLYTNKLHFIKIQKHKYLKSWEKKEQLHITKVLGYINYEKVLKTDVFRAHENDAVKQ